MKRVLFDYSGWLLAGSAGALIFANVDHHNYETIAHNHIIHFFVNDVLMAVFFALAAKEILESFIPGGALRDLRKAATPLLATVGGMAGPVAVYLLGIYWYSASDLKNGWAIPCATDIAFAALFARLIFGKRHPAIKFILLLAIADDAGGLIILAVFYPQAPLEIMWVCGVISAMALCFIMRRLKVQSFWWYLLVPGVLSWFSFYFGGIHAALGLVPVIFCMPHAKTDLGCFAAEELNRDDTLSEFEHFWKNPVEIFLGLFGFVNAGVVFGSVGTGTGLVLAGLLIGKPLGISLFSAIGCMCGLKLPDGMRQRDVLCLGMVGGIGFTVALFVTTAAFPEPSFTQDTLKMGALASFSAAILAIMMAWIFRVERMTEEKVIPEQITVHS